MQQHSNEAGMERRLSPETIDGLMSGKIQLGQFLGLSRDLLYRIAQIGHQILAAGRLPQARRIYEGLVAAEPFNSIYCCLLGAVYHRLGELDLAVEAYTRALELDRRNGDALAGRGEVYLQRGQRQEAIRDLSEAIKLDPEGEHPTAARARALVSAINGAAS
jgi:tetratricopeptide (TPR) repeat protein